MNKIDLSVFRLPDGEDDLALRLHFQDTKSTPYRHWLAQSVKSPLAALFLQQADYWWRTVGCRPFYKFNESCGHPLYKAGDSWTEELGFTKRQFLRARDTVSVKRTTGDDWAKIVKTCHDERKPVIYWTDGDRKTYYAIQEPAWLSLLRHAIEQTKITERDLGEGGKIPKRDFVQNTETVFTLSEITTEITFPENTTNGSADAGLASQAIQETLFDLPEPENTPPIFIRRAEWVEWLKKIEKGNQRVAGLVHMISVLYPDKVDAVKKEYSFVGKILREDFSTDIGLMGGAIYDAQGHAVDGEKVLTYVKQCAPKNKNGRPQGNGLPQGKKTYEEAMAEEIDHDSMPM